MSEEEILIALKEIHARYCIPASEQNYTDKDYACMQYEKLIIHLQKEIERLNNIINGLEEYINPYLYMLNGIQDRDIYEQCQLDDFTDIMEKLQKLKENK